MARLGVPCIICGETALLTEEEEFFAINSNMQLPAKVCGKCKLAVKWARAQMVSRTKIIIDKEEKENG